MKYFTYGTSLRHVCSTLNAGYFYYFFECKLHNQQRQLHLNSWNSYVSVNLQFAINAKYTLINIYSSLIFIKQKLRYGKL